MVPRVNKGNIEEKLRDLVKARGATLTADSVVSSAYRGYVEMDGAILIYLTKPARYWVSICIYGEDAVIFSDVKPSEEKFSPDRTVDQAVVDALESIDGYVQNASVQRQNDVTCHITGDLFVFGKLPE